MKKIERKYKSTYFDKAITFLTLFFIFFPWLSFGLNDLDTQPWPIFTNFLFIFFYMDRKLKHFIFIGYVILILIFLVAIAEFGYNSLRSALAYLIFFSTLHVMYIIFNNFSVFFNSLLAKFNIIWLLSGILQITFGKNVLDFLVSVRTSVDRGVTGLAPEPTHYAFFLMFLSWLILLSNNDKPSRKNLILIFLNIFFIVFVAKSSMVLFYCVLFILYIIFSYANIKQILKLVPLVIVSLYIFLIFLLDDTNSRISKVISTVISNPLNIVKYDASINSRVSAPVLSIYTSVKDYFVPHGFNSYQEAAIKANEDLNGFFWYQYSTDKIMSGTGSLLYELGWIGLAIIVLSYFIMSGTSMNYKKSLMPFILLWVLLLGAIPMSFTLIPCVIIAYYFLNSNVQSRSKTSF